MNDAPLVPLRILSAAPPEMRTSAERPAAADDTPGLGLTAMGPVGSERKIREWALVLQSSEIWHAIRHTWAGWVLLVRDEDYPLAASA